MHLEPGSVSKNINLMYAINLLSMLKLTMPIWVLFLNQHVTNTQIAFLTSWLFGSVLLLELPTGVLADLLGKKTTIALGLLVATIANFVYPFSNSFWHFLIIFSLLAFGEAMASGADEALIYDTLKEQNQEKNFRKINANFNFVTQIGFVIANVLGGWLFSINTTFPFLIYSFILLIAFLLSLLLREPSIDSEVFNFKNYLKQTKDGLLQLTKHKWIYQLSLFYIFVGGISWTFQRLLNFMVLSEVGITAIGIGLIMGGFRLFNVLVLRKIVTLKFLEKSGFDLVILPLLMVFSYIPAYWSGKYLTILLVGGAMIASTGRFMILNPYLNEVIDSKYRATTLSALNMLVSLVLIISILISGPLVDLYSARWVMTIFGIVSAAILFPLTILVFKRRKKYLIGSHLI